MKPTFSAALLAGGRSIRMGRDKALLPLPSHLRSSADAPLLLWQRQLAVLEDLLPDEIFWSGPVRPGLPTSLHQIDDAIPGTGPLAGVSACLDRLKSDLLLVLAIDLPQMAAPFLGNLLDKSSAHCGTVARRGEFFEPLAAVYPKSLATVAAAQLKAGRYAMQDFIRLGVTNRSLQAVPLASSDFPLFENLNEPRDLGDVEKSCNQTGTSPV